MGPAVHVSTSGFLVQLELALPLAGAGYAGGIVSAAVDGLRVGSVIAAEVTGVPSSLSSDFKVQMGY